MTGLSAADRDVIARARELAGADDLPALAAVTGSRAGDPAMLIHAEALGVAQHLLAALAAIADRLGSGEDQDGEPGEDAGRLGRIRVVLAGFDWEHDDRQYALEAIDRIAEGGQPDEGPDPDRPETWAFGGGES